ncbi:hypothetical protein JMF94_05325 [Desulfovibrio sp. UIB00]|uniref:hypothetical protein n=1 Tax=Desulfovibrio sp. UIB00 TaxID=2804314 RepID=UPI001F0D7944|nr:hypothetical protein [Desulfovibrio sp. UIB00]MCH5144502.1 hypothetical protein [Desulfovibrio sp. UIB00]
MLDDIKVIKFFIRINNVPCHSFDDLQKNFYVQDVISLHRQGVLARWLRVVGHKDKADALPAATEMGDDIALGQKLVEVLCPGFDKNNLRAALDALGFETLAAERAALAAQGQKNWSAFATAYHGKFEDLLRQAAQRRSDFEFLCQVAICLVDNYWNLVEENVEKFIQRLFVEVPCLFFPLIAMGKFRKQEYENSVRAILAEHIKKVFYIKTDSNESWYEHICTKVDYDIIYSIDVTESSDPFLHHWKRTGAPMQYISKQIPSTIEGEGEKIIGEMTTNIYFHQIKKQIDSWDDVVQDKSKKIMLIYADSLAHMRPVRSRDDYTDNDINSQFPVFCGLDYKSTNNNPLVVYIDLPKCVSERASESHMDETECNN